MSWNQSRAISRITVSQTVAVLAVYLHDVSRQSSYLLEARATDGHALRTAISHHLQEFKALPPLPVRTLACCATHTSEKRKRSKQVSFHLLMTLFQLLQPLLSGSEVSSHDKTMKRQMRFPDRTSDTVVRASGSFAKAAGVIILCDVHLATGAWATFFRSVAFECRVGFFWCLFDLLLGATWFV